MMTVNIPLLSFLQRAFVITLPENQKTNCGEKKVSCNLLDSHLLQLTIRYLKCQRANMILKYHHKMSNSEKKVYYFLKKVYSFFHVFRIPYIALKTNVGPWCWLPLWSKISHKLSLLPDKKLIRENKWPSPLEH